MKNTMYERSVVPMLRGFGVLEGYINRAAEFVVEKGLDEADIVDARLSPDMKTFAGQIQLASDKSRYGIARLAGVKPPSYADDERTLEQLRTRIALTRNYLLSLDHTILEDSEHKVVELKFRTLTGKFVGHDYLQIVLMPDFYFHIATAHGILRNKGLQIGKTDYLGRLS